MIEVVGLSKRFGPRLALDHVSFEVPGGTVTAFLGPNGAGKTTAMRLVLGLDRPTAGHAFINGRPLREWPDPLCQVGALLGARFAHPRRSAFDHLLAVATTHGIPRSRVHDVIEETGLESVAGERVGRFSLGMTQRLGIAGALLGSPTTLILDEPVNGLDLDGVRWFRNLCRDYADRGAAVFLSSHLMSEVELVADRVIVLGRGRVIADSAIAELRKASARIEVVTRDVERFAAELRAAGADVRMTGDSSCSVAGLSAGDVGAAALQTGVMLERLAEEARSLESSYRDLTEGTVEFTASPVRIER